MQHRANSGNDAHHVLTMNQKRKAAQAGHFCQVRAHETPRTSAAHTKGAGDNHLVLLAHHDVCTHAAEITLRQSPGAVQCSSSTPTPLGGPRPLFPLL